MCLRKALNEKNAGKQPQVSTLITQQQRRPKNHNRKQRRKQDSGCKQGRQSLRQFSRGQRYHPHIITGQPKIEQHVKHKSQIHQCLINTKRSRANTHLHRPVYAQHIGRFHQRIYSDDKQEIGYKNAAQEEGQR